VAQSGVTPVTFLADRIKFLAGSEAGMLALVAKVADADNCWGGRPHGIECQNWVARIKTASLEIGPLRCALAATRMPAAGPLGACFYQE
jgi:hypothetical protein